MDMLEALRAFHAVAQARSFTRGAHACGVPQPVASRRIAALERHLGATLLDRTSRSVSVSARGEQILPHVREVLEQIDHIESMSRLDRPELTMAIPVGVDPRWLAAIRRGIPGAGVTFDESSAPERRRAWEGGRADVAVLVDDHDADGELTIALGIGAVHDTTRPFRLATLRSSASARERSRPVLHIDHEDDTPSVRDPLRRAAAAHGLRMDQLAVGTPRTEALVRVHERGEVVLCTEREAGAAALGWRPLAGLELRRRLTVRVSPAARQAIDVAELTGRLRRGLGAGG